MGGPSPDQIDAMRESMEILSDPEMLGRVRAGRKAVAAGDLVGLEELPGGSVPSPGGWRVVLAGPVARELAEVVQPGSATARAMLAELATSPAERGRALGMGLVGVYSAHGDSDRILYAIDQQQRLVTVLSVDSR